MGLFDYQPSPATTDLLKRLQGGLVAPPNPLGAPQGDPSQMGGPMTPPLAPPQEQPPSPQLPVANAPTADQLHQHESGIKGGLMHLLGADKMAPEVAALLTPEQQQAVRPGLARSLWGVLAEGQLPDTIMEKRAAETLGLVDAKKARDQREISASIYRKHAPVVMAARNEQERYDAMANMAADLAASGDPEAMKVAPNMLNAIKPDKAGPLTHIPNGSWVPDGQGGFKQLGSEQKAPVTRNTAKGIEAYNFDTKKWDIQKDENGHPIMPFSPPVQYAYSALPGAQMESGTVPILNTKTGQIQDSGVPVKEAAGAGSAINMAAKARLTAAISEMNNAHNGMRDFEKGLSDGTIKISAPAQVLGRVANAFTHDDPLSQLTQSGTLSLLNRTDPALARYIRRGLSFAEGESMISQRPSDFRTKMAAFLSTAASGASPEMIADISGRRNSILTPLNETMAAGKSTSHGAPPKVTLEQRVAELKAQGKSKDEARAILKAERLIP